MGTSTFTPDNTYVKDGQLVLRAKKTNAEEPQTGGDSDDDEGSDDDNNDSDDKSGDGSDKEDLKEGSEDDNDSDKSLGDDYHEESSEEPDFHVLPSPKSGTLDSAIEKTTRVLVSMVRTELNNFSQSMS